MRRRASSQACSASIRRRFLVDPASGSTPRDCILFSTADWDEPYWTNKQHTATLMAEMGWRVLYVESVGFRAPRMGSKKDWGRLWRRLWRGIQSVIIGPPQRASGIWVLSPLIFPLKHHLPVVRWFNQSLLRLAVGQFVRRKRMIKPMVWTYHPFMLDAVAQLDRGPIVYHCVDDITAVPGVDVQAFLGAERELLTQAQAAFATAQFLQDRCARYNANTYYFGNVVDDDFFGRALQPGAIPDDLREIPHPRLVYHGVLSDFKLDFPLVRAVAELRPDWHWIFIGKQREGQRSAEIDALAMLPNVHFLGYRHYATLPDYLRGMDVGVLPSLLNEYTRAMFPMKYFEYLAAGLRVVSTPLAFTRAQADGAEVAATPPDFVVAVERQLKRGKLSQEQVRQYVGENTWAGRMEKMMKIVDARGVMR